MLTGVGLGPGDPELLTLKAVRLIREADAVYVPGKRAYELVRPYREPVQIEFPMRPDEDEIRRCLEVHADRIAAVAKKGLVVFGLIGDPNFFSTYSRLCAIMEKRHPGIVCSTEPGVSAITAFAAIAKVAVQGGFSVSDGTGECARILLKVRRPREAADRLRHEGYTRFVLVERMYMEGEKVHLEVLPEESDYFSILYAEM